MSDKHLVADVISTGQPDKGQAYHFSNLTDAEREQRYGRGDYSIDSDIIAGSTVTICFRFTVGKKEMSQNSRLRVAWRWPFDWADLQKTNPESSNHLTVKAPENVHLAVQYEQKGNLNPWLHNIDLRVTQGHLQQGDIVDLTCARWQAPTFATLDGYFLFLVNIDEDNCWFRLSDPPRFNIIPGPPDHLIAIAPSDGVIGESSIVRVRAVDAWENPTSIPKPQLLCQKAEIDEPGACDKYPVWEFPVRWKAPGIQRLRATCQNLEAETNPVQVYLETPEQRIYWGDLHSGQSEIGCGVGTLENHYAYARDVASLQFTSQQANDHYITRAMWKHVRSITPKYNDEGKFLAILGCEWSPPTEDGGDRNVLYRHDEPRMRRSGRFFTETEPDPEPDLPHATEFLETFKKEQVLLNLHVGGRPTNLAYHAPEIEPLFEIHSTHATSEWFVFEAIERGYKVGITAGTDGVMGRPGACGPGRRMTRNVRNGLTAIYAGKLTQDALWDASFARRCYGTTGARILLQVQVNGHPMGSVFTTDAERCIDIRIEGTAPIEQVELLRCTEVLCTWQIARYDPKRIRVLWGGAETRGNVTDQRQTWNGNLRIQNGRFDKVNPVALQCPNDRITTKENHITFVTATAGNDMGFTFNVAGSPNTTLHFTSEPCTFNCTIAQVIRAPLVVDAGGLNRRVEIGPAPLENGIKSLGLTYTDTTFLPGESPYWVRVTQTDRHRAWSSPIYVEKAKD